MPAFSARNLLLLVAATNAWGGKVHGIIGQIASEFLTPATKEELAIILGPSLDITNPATSAKAWSDIANWADIIKKANRNGYLHYIDSNDNPSAICKISEDDCPGLGADGKIAGPDKYGSYCITQAIGIYTANAKSSDAETQLEAIKYLAHFVGDITMPLHNIGREMGGNSKKPVIFQNALSTGGYTHTLHGIWDFNMPDKLILENYMNNTSLFIADLVAQIKTGEYKGIAESWYSNIPVDAKTDKHSSLLSLEWSAESNAYNCQGYIWDAYDKDPTTDLAGAYYQNAVPLIKLQIAKAGYRLATLYNDLFDPCEDETTTTISPTSTDSFTTVPATTVPVTSKPITTEPATSIPFTTEPLTTSLCDGYNCPEETSTTSVISTTIYETTTCKESSTTQVVVETTTEACAGYNCPEITLTEILFTTTDVVAITTDGPTPSDGPIISGSRSVIISSISFWIILFSI